MVNNKLAISSIIFMITVVLYSCSKPTDGFERNNIQDPLYEEFEPRQLSTLEVSLTPDSTVKLIWLNNTNIEDGYLIEKLLTESSPDQESYSEIGRTEADITTFIDTSKQYTPDTFYKASAFVEKNDSIYVLSSQVSQIPEFTSVSNFGYEYISDEQFLKVSWEINSLFEVHAEIEYKTDGETDYRLLLETNLKSGDFADELADISFLSRHYKLSISLIYNETPVLIETSEFTMSGTLFAPSDLTAEIIDVYTVELTWKDNSHFEQGYKVYRSERHFENQSIQYELVADLPANSAKYHDQLTPDTDKIYTYMVVGYKDNTEQKSNEASLYP